MHHLKTKLHHCYKQVPQVVLYRGGTKAGFTLSTSLITADGQSRKRNKKEVKFLHLLKIVKKENLFACIINRSHENKALIII